MISADDPGARPRRGEAVRISASSPSERRRTPTCASPTSAPTDRSSFTAHPRRRHRARCSLRVPGVHNAVNAAGAVAVLAHARLRSRAPPSARSRASAAPCAASSCTASSGGSASTTTTRTTPPRSPRRSRRPHGRRGRAHHRDPPAAHVLAHPAHVPGVRRGARVARRPHHRARRLRRTRRPGPRCDGRTRHRRASPIPRTCTSSPTGRRRRTTPPSSPATATTSSRSAAATSTRSSRRCWTRSRAAPRPGGVRPGVAMRPRLPASGAPGAGGERAGPSGEIVGAVSRSAPRGHRTGRARRPDPGRRACPGGRPRWSSRRAATPTA